MGAIGRRSGIGRSFGGRMTGLRGPYRDRLAMLATDGVVEAHLDAWAARRSVDRLGPWRRVYGKLRPGRSPWAVLVYDAVGAPTVQVRLLEGGVPAAGGAAPAPDADGLRRFAVAEPHGWDERSMSSWYGVVPGTPARADLFGPQGAALAGRIGACLGELA